MSLLGEVNQNGDIALAVGLLAGTTASICFEKLDPEHSKHRIDNEYMSAMIAVAAAFICCHLPETHQPYLFNVLKVSTAAAIGYKFIRI